MGDLVSRPLAEKLRGAFENELIECPGGNLSVTCSFGAADLRPWMTAPVELFDGPYTLDLMGHQREDVASDGRFLMVENSDDFPIVIVQNWALELGRVVR